MRHLPFVISVLGVLLVAALPSRAQAPATLVPDPIPDAPFVSASTRHPGHPALVNFVAPPVSAVSQDQVPALTTVPPAFALTPSVAQSQTSGASGREPFHWKGLLLQSFAFDMLQNSTRIITADQNDRHILLNKPFWSDYWASLGQFNMRRWNDGDSFQVNYVGHPMQGAISGYIELQNDPRGRALRLDVHDPEYWHSRERAFIWQTVYSTQWEIGPLGETAIFNQGGFTYPIRCSKRPTAPDYCEKPTSTYTNNTGWVDFIVTPTIGSVWLVGEDFLDRYISDPLVARHPGSFGYKLVRSSLNPTRSLANMLRGRFPWYRDFEHPLETESPIVQEFEQALEAEPSESVDLHLFYSALALRTSQIGCISCRRTTTGAGTEVGLRVRRYIDVVTTVRVQPDASPLSAPNIGGSLLTAHFGLRAGYSGRFAALKVSLSPGFASYARAAPAFSQMPSATDPPGTAPETRRNFNFSAIAAIDADARVNRHFALRATVEQMLIRYKSPVRDPPGIGTPPRLSFLSHDNYSNETNWGLRLGPVFRF